MVWCHSFFCFIPEKGEIELAERALAHIEKIEWIKEIPGADNIELIGVLGWQCISKKNEFKVGDIAVYIEIDSKCPAEDERFAFLENKHYKVKTMKLGKFNCASQGLALPIALFPELSENKIGDDVTDKLKIVYSVEEDNIRKGKKADNDAKYKAMAQRKKNLAQKKWWRWLMRREWGKRLLFLFFGKKKDNPRVFPNKFEFVHRTDENRIENAPWLLENKDPWTRTLKIDGTSSTYILERKKRNKYEYYVCSRNVRQLDKNQENYHDLEDNVYWEMSDKYHIYDFLKDMLDEHKDWDYVCLQGEIAGEGVQKNPHKLKGRQFFGFNFIDSQNGRWNTVNAATYCNLHDIPWVPIIDTSYTLPDTMEEMKESAVGQCDIPGSSGLREGFVYRSLDGKTSFKNVSIPYLMKHNG